ncbi:hypothetical protein GCM10027286_04640 [Virgibacillus ainsalahensis]
MVDFKIYKLRHKIMLISTRGSRAALTLDGSAFVAKGSAFNADGPALATWSPAFVADGPALATWSPAFVACGPALIP